MRRYPADLKQQLGSLGQPTLPAGMEMPLEMCDINAPSINMTGQGGWVALWETNVHHYTRGQLWVSVDAVPTGVPALGLWADVRVITQRGVSDIVAIGAVNNASGPLIYRWSAMGESVAFDGIKIEARQVLNGVPSSTGAESMTLGVFGRLYR